MSDDPDPAWVDVFGERTILQRPDLMGDAPPPEPGRGGDTWLMLFEDGSRIDLTLRTVAEMASYRPAGPTRVLVDRAARSGEHRRRWCMRIESTGEIFERRRPSPFFYVAVPEVESAAVRSVAVRWEVW
jgi:hypothetical protein